MGKWQNKVRKNVSQKLNACGRKSRMKKKTISRSKSTRQLVTECAYLIHEERHTLRSTLALTLILSSDRPLTESLLKLEPRVTRMILRVMLENLETIPTQIFDSLIGEPSNGMLEVVDDTSAYPLANSRGGSMDQPLPLD
jgi:hypothetical protein